VQQPERKVYLKNAYRVLLTRARQGMVIVVPEGTPDDPTRAPAYYESTFEYLRNVGMPVI
jgi:ubiquinone/menaquinone biosynthesis C-methylase UbiE